MSAGALCPRKAALVFRLKGGVSQVWVGFVCLQSVQGCAFLALFVVRLLELPKTSSAGGEP